MIIFLNIWLQNPLKKIYEGEDLPSEDGESIRAGRFIFPKKPHENCTKEYWGLY